MISKLRVSLVLPAYNESDYLRECLNAIACQSVMPYEVIVVDNNSMDDTAAIAKSFPFVKLLHEPKQGVLHARTAGFNAAKGDIIGRIDCDTILSPDWVKTVREIFSESDIAATSGAMEYGDIAWSSVIDRLEVRFRRWLAHSFDRTDTVFLQGASMAMRTDAWHAVRPSLCDRKDIHEDYDIALHLQQMGYKVSFDERLVATLSMRRIDASFMSIVRYANVSPHSYMVHNAQGWLRMYLVIGIALLAYLPARILYRGYVAETDSFSFSKLLTRTESRVSPVASIE